MKKYFKASIIILILLSCIKKDKTVTILEIKNEKYNWYLEDPKEFQSKNFKVTAYLNQKNQDVFERLAYYLFVDNRIAAKQFLLSRYDILFLEVKNKTKSKKDFKLSQMKIKSNDQNINFFYPEELPDQFQRLNPKGLSKNVYNSLVMTVSIVPILVLSLGEGMAKAKADRQRMDEFQRYQRYVYTPPPVYPEKERGFSFSRYFSSILHMNYVEYKDVFHEDNEIERLGTKSGVLFLEKGVLSKQYTIIYNE